VTRNLKNIIRRVASRQNRSERFLSYISAQYELMMSSMPSPTASRHVYFCLLPKSSVPRTPCHVATSEDVQIVIYTWIIVSTQRIASSLSNTAVIERLQAQEAAARSWFHRLGLAGGANISCSSGVGST
jgi:hypothetical protein